MFLKYIYSLCVNLTNESLWKIKVKGEKYKVINEGILRVITL